MSGLPFRFGRGAINLVACEPDDKPSPEHNDLVRSVRSPVCFSVASIATIAPIPSKNMPRRAPENVGRRSVLSPDERRNAFRTATTFVCIFHVLCLPCFPVRFAVPRAPDVHDIIHFAANAFRAPQTCCRDRRRWRHELVDELYCARARACTSTVGRPVSARPAPRYRTIIIIIS